MGWLSAAMEDGEGTEQEPSRRLGSGLGRAVEVGRSKMVVCVVLKQGGRWIPGGALSALALLLGAERTRLLMCLIPTDHSPLMTAAPSSRVYGVSLRTHLQDLGRDIALPIEACVLLLLSEGMQEEVGAEA